ncbi:hypothetical protein M409DRAFT_57495 [Zasmidium cellare ATCC 36951]|uniref:Uncharacterized protein n=1 Tax=Zasmidium cellare ATCC 36951 TaxID=1080233 RepID=A0A6A6C904_ZASCE|nr:uncharacterized protein M409DRAFT_57495 [Zasmidium cellare ATCC 36951]KAF2163624.1 hypothetical protein M409DRAFT_57495 [Zasmidium cellare ATCC 36951]
MPWRLEIAASCTCFLLAVQCLLTYEFEPTLERSDEGAGFVISIDQAMRRPLKEQWHPLSPHIALRPGYLRLDMHIEPSYAFYGRPGGDSSASHLPDNNGISASRSLGAGLMQQQSQVVTIGQRPRLV